MNDADAQPALRIVERLMGTFRPALGGVLVEDESLEICKIPNQRVIHARGTTTLAPSVSQLRTLMKADARAFQMSLARTANPDGTRVAFAQERGNLVHTVLHAAAGWDVLILGYRQVHKRQGKIVVFGSERSGGDVIDTIARALADQLRTEQVFFNTENTSTTKTAGTLHFATLKASLKALTRMNAEAVLVDLRQGLVRNKNDLAQVLEAARCPVIVFGASSTAGQLTQSTQIPPSGAQ